MTMRGMVACVSATVVLALVACSPGGSSPNSPSPAVAAAAPPDAAGCSSPDVKTTLGQIVWEEAENAASKQLGTLQEARGVVAEYKARATLTFTGVAAVPAQGAGRPTCEATIVATADVPISETITLLQRAMNVDGNLKLSGKELVGAVSYTVTPTDDGTSFRVSARGFQAFSMGLGGMALVSRLERFQAEFEAKENAKKTAAVPTVAPVGTTVPEQQASSEDRYAEADKALNAAYAALRARLDDAGKTALRDEQRGWVRTRDATCSEAKIAAESGGDVVGGSAMTLEVAGCKAKLTEARTKQLAAKG